MIAVRLPEEMETQLNQYAENAHKTKTDVVKEALALYFHTQKASEAQKTPYQLGEALFGKYQSGESNRSETYKQKLNEKLRAK